MKKTISLFVAFLLILSLQISALAEEPSIAEPFIAAAYCEGDTVVDFVDIGEEEGSVKLSTNDKVASGDELERFAKTGEPSVFGVLLDVSTSMEGYAEQAESFVNTLLGSETIRPRVVVLPFHSKLLEDCIFDSDAYDSAEEASAAFTEFLGEMKFTDSGDYPYLRIKETAEILDGAYPVGSAGIVNLVVFTDLSLNYEEGSANYKAAAQSVGESPELLVHTVNVGKPDKYNGKLGNRGLNLRAQNTTEAAETAELLLDYVGDLRVAAISSDLVETEEDRFPLALYLHVSDGNKSNIRVIPVSTENVPRVETLEKTELLPEQRKDTDEGNNPTSPEKETLSAQSDETTDVKPVPWGIYAAIAAVAAAILLAVVLVSKSRKKAAASDNGIFVMLSVNSGDCKTKKPELYLKDELIIGRDAKCDIVFKDKDVSRRNSRIFEENGIIYIEDLDSMNGTYVEGIRIRSANRLRSGDMISIGCVQFTLNF